MITEPPPHWIPGRPRIKPGVARNDGWFGDTRERGVTLVELVVVMTLLGIIAAVAAVALRDPVRAYADSNRRAELTDMADTALRRMARDIRLALPNSLRVSGTNLELLLTRTGGRYREQQNDTGQGDVLDFAAPDTQFDTLGTMSVVPASTQNGDILVVYNLFSDSAITTSNAYTFGSGNCTASDSPNCNTSTISGTSAGALVNETRIDFAVRRFPHASPGNRFHVVQGPVTYECAPGALDAQGNATGTLTRIAGYTITLNQPTGTGFGTRALVTNNVATCDITYNPLVLTQSLGLVSISLTLTRGGESVHLYHEVHVTNIP